jgi:hypothetical protein
MSFLLFWLEATPRVELVVVMIIIPMIVNTVQFWLTDMFLKHDESDGSISSRIPVRSGVKRRYRDRGSGRAMIQLVEHDHEPDLDQGLLESEVD